MKTLYGKSDKIAFFRTFLDLFSLFLVQNVLFLAHFRVISARIMQILHDVEPVSYGKFYSSTP